MMLRFSLGLICIVKVASWQAGIVKVKVLDGPRIVSVESPASKLGTGPGNQKCWSSSSPETFRSNSRPPFSNLGASTACKTLSLTLSTCWRSKKNASNSFADLQVYIVTKNGVDQPAHILQRRAGEVYVHYLNTDKRLDEWIPEGDFRSSGEEQREESKSRSTRKRKRGTSETASRPASLSPTRGRSAGTSGSNMPLEGNGITGGEEVIMTEEDFDIQHHKQITAQRNFDKVNFGHWQIKTWYFSPYPLTETEADEVAMSQGASSASPLPKIPGVNRATMRSHGRTSDLLAGGLGRTHGLGEKSILWVCDRCFKYMADGLSWELHMKNCPRSHPPGRKVYQRGAHTIWEVDGAKDKLYCQNLSLFGKLFIDVKTLFFDCDNFLFYILTDADSRRDHVLGFFSKEKVSYDDYNLACIITLPPYQRKGYGMLMIEFSYELSRRAGKVGTPERPLSDLGLRSYLAYWVSTLVRFLRRLLSVVPPEESKIVSVGSLPDLRSPSRDPEDGAPKRKKRTKGWDGEASEPSLGMAPLSSMDDSLFTSLRTFEATPNPDGSATMHVVVKCTLKDIARATNLREEDAAFALNECGLLSGRVKDRNGDVDGNGSGEEEEAEEEEIIVLSRQMVEAVAVQRKVKMMCMDLSRVLL